MIRVLTNEVFKEYADELIRAQIFLVPDSFLSKLGNDFLYRYYREIVNSDYCKGFIYIHEGKLAGYITATKDVYRLMTNAIRKSFARIIIGSFLMLFELLKLFFYAFFNKDENVSATKAELTTFGVLPEYRKVTLDGPSVISKELLKNAIDWFKNEGVEQVRVGTKNNNKRMNNLITRAGFKVLYAFKNPVTEYEDGERNFMWILELKEKTCITR